MALLTPQVVSVQGTDATFAAPTTSDTIAADSGLLLYVKNGGTATTVTVVVPGNQPYSGAATSDITQTFTSDDRQFYIHPGLADPATGLVTVTFSSVATVTVRAAQDLMAFVAVYNREVRGLWRCPEELLDHWADLGWVPVPESVNLRDPQAVKELLAPKSPAKRPANPGTADKEK